MDLRRFFTRIGFKGEPKTDYETLARIQESFLLNVPFENLDIHYGPKKLTVSPEAAYDKIVNHGRGGFCYECNSLLWAILKKIGFQVDIYSCRMVSGPIPTPDFSHMLLKVTLDGLGYFTDVGNGRSYRRPLRVDGSEEQSIPEGYSYRVGPHIEGDAVYFRCAEQSWTPRYFFTATPRELSQFEERCLWYQTNPESFFAKGPLVTIATRQGRKSLFKDLFSNVVFGVEQHTPVTSEQEFLRLLDDEFHYPVGELSGQVKKDCQQNGKQN